MTIIVETGSVLDGSPRPNSYVTISQANDFFAQLVDAVWENADDEQKEAALIKAQRYMVGRYRMRWLGSRVTAFQALDWPRRGVPVVDFLDPIGTRWFSIENGSSRYLAQSSQFLNYSETVYYPSNTIPREVLEAQMMLARETMDDSGISNVVLQPNLGRVTKREKLGDLEVEYADGVGNRQVQIYYEVEQSLASLLSNTSSNRVVRA